MQHRTSVRGPQARAVWHTRRLGIRHTLATGLIAAALAAGSLAMFPASARAETVHVIQPGESLAGIARQYAVEPGQLAAYNSISDPNHIVIGQQLAIPPKTAAPSEAAPAAGEPLPGAAGYHIVLPGESLSQIARRYDIALSDLLRLNSLSDVNTIWIGQEIRLSARVAPVAAQQSSALEVADEIHVVQVGDTLAQIARDNNTTIEQIMRVNGLPNSGFIYVGQMLRIHTPPPVDPANLFAVAGAPADGRRVIQVDLSDQTLSAWQGDVRVFHTTVSTGKAATPTIIGDFAIGTKYSSQHMVGDDYDLPGVPWVMYFHGGYAIHGAYWHANFGTPTSHGCINMRIPEAEALYAWADAGTAVVVRE